LAWIARNPLKSPESDEGIQINPRDSKPIFLGFLENQEKPVFLGLAWVRLGGIRPRRYRVGRSLLARLSTRVDEAGRRGRSEIRLGSYEGTEFGANDVEIARAPIDIARSGGSGAAPPRHRRPRGGVAI
jgi:hypothetical protein